MVVFAGFAWHVESVVIVPGPEFYSIKDANEFTQTDRTDVVGMFVDGHEPSWGAMGFCVVVTCSFATKT